MEKLMPIEPGCLCLVTSGVDTGKIVTAVRCLGRVRFSDYGGVTEFDQGWEIDQYLEAWDNELTNVVGESILLRIDGNDFSHETEQEKERVEG